MKEMRLGELLSPEECREEYGCELPSDMVVYKVNPGSLGPLEEKSFKQDLLELLDDKDQGTILDMLGADRVGTSVAASIIGQCCTRNNYIGLIIDNSHLKLLEIMIGSPLKGRIRMYSSVKEASDDYIQRVVL